MADDKKHVFTNEELDYLTEMMNIGSGNAGVVLSQLLQARVDIRIPILHIIGNMEDAKVIFQEKTQDMACVKMQMIGDVKGSINFTVAVKQTKKFLLVATKAMTGMDNDLRDRDYNIAALSEIGNSIADVYLSAIYEFCRLRIFHTVPAYKHLTIGDFFREIFSQNLNNRVLLIENELILEKERLTTYLLLIVSPGGEEKMLGSIKAARGVYGDTGEKNNNDAQGPK